MTLLSMNNCEEEVSKRYRRYIMMNISNHEVLLKCFVIHLSGAITSVIYFCSGYDDKNH